MDQDETIENSSVTNIHVNFHNSNTTDFVKYLKSTFFPDDLENELENKGHILNSSGSTKSSNESQPFNESHATNTSIDTFNGIDSDIMNTLESSIYPNIYPILNSSYALSIYNYLSSLFIKPSNFTITNNHRSVSLENEEEDEILGETANFTSKLNDPEVSSRGDLGVFWLHSSFIHNVFLLYVVNLLTHWILGISIKDTNFFII